MKQYFVFVFCVLPIIIGCSAQDVTTIASAGGATSGTVGGMTFASAGGATSATAGGMTSASTGEMTTAPAEGAIVTTSVSVSKIDNPSSNCDGGKIVPGKRDCWIYCVIRNEHKQGGMYSYSESSQSIEPKKEGEACSKTEMKFQEYPSIMWWVNFHSVEVEGICNAHGWCITNQTK